MNQKFALTTAGFFLSASLASVSTGDLKAAKNYNGSAGAFSSAQGTSSITGYYISISPANSLNAGALIQSYRDVKIFPVA